MYPSKISFKHKGVSCLPRDLRPEVQHILNSDPSSRHILKSVDIHGMSYSPGLWVVLGCNGQDFVVGEILLIVIQEERIKFIVKKCVAENTHQGYYRTLQNATYQGVLYDD